MRASHNNLKIEAAAYLSTSLFAVQTGILCHIMRNSSSFDRRTAARLDTRLVSQNRKLRLD
jgi:hypothetical protein